MKKAAILGKTLKISLYIAVGAFVSKVLFSIILGYRMFPVEYSGPSYYFWRHAYYDKEIAKFSFSYIKPNTENVAEPFETYSAFVQSIKDGNEIKEKLKQNRKIRENSSEGSKAYLEADKEIKKYEGYQNDKLDVTNIAGLTPFYTSVSGYTDGFISSPKKSFRIFKNLEDKKATSPYLQNEFEFLAFRHLFLSYLNKLKGKSEKKNYFAIEKDKIENFFKLDESFEIEFLGKEYIKNTEYIKGERFIGDKPIVEITSKIAGVDKFSATMLQSHAEGALKYIEIYSDFNELIALIEKGESLVDIDVKNNVLTVKEEASDLIVKIAEKLNLLNYFENEDAFRTSLNEFVQRIASVKGASMDIHILNRFYYYYLFTRSDFKLEKESIPSNWPLHEHMTIRDDLLKKKEYDTLDKADEAKLKIFEEKVSKGRVELIFNKLSQDIANVLGEKTYLLDSKEDDRMFPFRYFAYPSTYKPSDKEKVTSPFSSQEVPVASE